MSPVTGESCPQPLVAVIGLGGVGSHCAHALLRAGIKRLRLVDFDRVSLSSLNRHAVASRRDVGIPKVVACANAFRCIAPGCSIDARDAMFNAEATETLLGPCTATASLAVADGHAVEGEVPDIVIDCIDDVTTKADLLEACLARGLPCISALGSGAKGDPTRLCVCKGLRDIENDALASKMRQTLKMRGVDVSDIPFVYSSQKAVRDLLPLTDEQRDSPESFGNVANFRLRVIPVLGSQPALAGVGVAVQTLLEMQGKAAAFTARPSPPLLPQLVQRFIEELMKRETVRKVDFTVPEAVLLGHEVFNCRSAFDTEHAVRGASGVRFTFARWDPELPIRPDNIVLCTREEADGHTDPTGVSPEIRQRIEARLSYMRSLLAVPTSANATDAKLPAAMEPASEEKDAAIDGAAWREQRKFWSADDEEVHNALLDEQLSRSSSFFGGNDAGHGRIRSAFVVVLGLGAVGSAAATMLARAGVGRLRLVDDGLVSGGCHALASAEDQCRPKVDVCRQRLLAIMPGCQVEACPRRFEASTADELLCADNGPDLVVDCLGGLPSKAEAIAAAVARGVRVVSVVACPGARDPTRIAVAPLADVTDSPAAVALRSMVGKDLPAGCLVAQSALAKGEARPASMDNAVGIDVVHSQEPWQWAQGCESETRPFELLVRLSLGFAASAVALHALAGEAAVKPPAAPAALSAWRKLRKDCKEAEAAGVDLYALGCVLDVIWGSRCAVTRRSGAGLKLVRWDHSKPYAFDNLWPLTEDEADYHEEATSKTGSLPEAAMALSSATAVSDGGGDRLHEDSSLDAQRLQAYRAMQLLQRHFAMCMTGRRRHLQAGVSASQTPAKGKSESLHTVMAAARLCNGSAALAPAGIGMGFAGLVGKTPLVELRSLSEATRCRIVAKAEFLNPGGCQKDRVARQILEDAEADGRLKPGATIVEGTSGSTGISLALAGSSKGYRVIVVMPDDQAAEKMDLLRRFGAELELVRPASISSPEHYVNVARRRAQEIIAAEGPGSALFANQFENMSNFRAHFVGTGPELWDQTEGHLDAFVMSSGTGGTLAGVGCYLKTVKPTVEVILADVQGSSLYNKVAHGVLYASEQAERTVRRHRMDTIAEGIGIDRLTGNMALGLREHNGGAPGVDHAVRVTDQEALEMAHFLLKHEGIFVGSSAAVNCVAACKVALRLGAGQTIATVLCDSGQRHLTKFYNRDVWPEYGLSVPTPRERGDISFVAS
eukprot:TRINITY_DN26452_c0_g1_i1.p1 TRINITY_DN26452_c0_g1~~TRINITY_DN26452_c0_g1_i1.p1  ORF type:complete len:1233 (-),score=191.62 TRINITY_DN26452_c0_g1_i1:177-3875(-)